MRGGSWNNNTRNLRSAERNNNNPDNRNNNLGFRVARTSTGHIKMAGPEFDALERIGACPAEVLACLLPQVTAGACGLIKDSPAAGSSDGENGGRALFHYIVENLHKVGSK